MKVNQCVKCDGFLCSDVNHSCYVVPGIEIEPEAIGIVLVSEVAPSDPDDYYYAQGQPLFEQTTVQAFRDAGRDVSSIRDIVDEGVYLTTAVKCAKTDSGIKTDTIRRCSTLLASELELFLNLQAVLLMGDVAIKALNYVSRSSGEGRAIPAGSTYKIRPGEYYYRNLRVFPSYLQAGPSFFIEKSKRQMIAQDIGRAYSVLGR